MPLHLRTATSVVALSLFGAGLPASADYLDETVLPYLDEAGIEVNFDAPQAIASGTRWQNVTITNGEADVELRFDWVEEVATEDGTRIRFSPRGAIAEAGDPDAVAELRTDAFFWDVQRSEDVQNHSVSAALLELRGEANGEGEFLTAIEGLDFKVVADLSSEILLQVSGQIAESRFEGRDLDTGTNRVDMRLGGVSLRHESVLPEDFFERAAALEAAGTEPDPQDVLDLMAGRSASTFALSEAEFSGRFDEPGAVEPAEFRVLASNLTGTFQGDARDGMDMGVGIQLDGIEGFGEAAQGGGQMAARDLAIDVNGGFSRRGFRELLETTAAGDDPGPEMLEELEVLYKVRSGGAEGDFWFEDGGMRGEARFEAGAGQEELGISDGEIFVSAQTEGANIAGTMPIVSPDEMSLSLGETQYTFSMPILPTAPGAVSTLVIQLFMRDYEASESVWALLDPGAAIPREPITIALDMEAGLNIMESFMDEPDFEEAVEIVGFKLNELTLRGGGAEILGDGATTVDMSGPIPVGDGQFNIELNGLIGLSGALAQLGVVPSEALLGLRGALGAFAQPVGNDAFASQIVLSPDGTITANGIPLPLD